MSYEIVTLKQGPILQSQWTAWAWPKFLRHANTHHWSSLFDTFADYQLILYEPEDGVLAVGHTIPLIWDGTLEDLPEEMNAIMDRAMYVYQHQQAPTTLSAIAAIVGREHQRKGLAPSS
jgi:hypothetical protein